MANGAMRAWDGTQWVTLPAAAPNPGAIAQAINVNFAPTGDIAATNVQAALAELDSEKAKLAGSASQAFSASTLTATTGNITTVNSTTVTGTNVNSTNSTITNLTTTNALVTNLNTHGSDYVNPVLNPTFDVWTFGDNINVTSHLQKLADRWNYDFNGTLGTLNFARIDLRTNSSLSALGLHPKNGVRAICSSAPSGNTFQDMSTQIESVLTYAGRQITISFFAVSLSGGPKDILIKTEQYFGGGGSPSAPRFNTSSPVTIGTSWARHSVTFNLTAVTQADTLGINGDDTLNIIFTLPLNQTFDLVFTGVKVEPGSITTPFEPKPYSVIANDCQRYAVSSYDQFVAPGTITNSGVFGFTQRGANDVVTIELPQRLSHLPTGASVKLYNPVTGAQGVWNNAGTPVTVAVNTFGTKNITIALTGGTAGNFCTGHYVIEDPFY